MQQGSFNKTEKVACNLLEKDGKVLRELLE
jgi:hypothetical protein